MSRYSKNLIEHYSERLVRRSGYERPGFAEGYDSHRPAPPAALLDVLCLEAQVERPRLVVDLGSGTGLSTRAWADRAEEVVGVEGSPEMRAQAEAATAVGNVRFLQAFAQETGLPDGAADVVTCSQSFHWMEPEPTLAEAARILRPGGVFAAYDYDWPPVVDPEVEAAFGELIRRVGRMRAKRGRPGYSKDEHLDRIRESGHFKGRWWAFYAARVETLFTGDPRNITLWHFWPKLFSSDTTAALPDADDCEDDGTMT